jgi:hypothetical protein
MLRRSMLRAVVLLAPLVLTAGTHRLRAADDPRPPTATVIARIGNLPIYRSELDVALRRAGAERIRSPEQSLRLEAEALEQAQQHLAGSGLRLQRDGADLLLAQEARP